MHDWKKITLSEYYSMLIKQSPYTNFPIYFICKKCGAKCKQYMYQNDLTFDNDNSYPKINF